MSAVTTIRTQLPRDAQAAYEQGDYRRAEELFRTLCREQRYKPGWRLELASVLIAMVEFAEAEQLLEEAITLAGGNTSITRWLPDYFRMLRYRPAKRRNRASRCGWRKKVCWALCRLERERCYEESGNRLERALRGHS